MNSTATRIASITALADSVRETAGGIIYLRKGNSLFSMFRDDGSMAEIIGHDDANQETTRSYFSSFKSFRAAVVAA